MALRPMQLAVEWLASRLKIPREATGMFRAASAMSGLDSATLPTELIPLNSLQLARGVLNFTILQSLRDWILPYWAVHQYDPGDPAFVPRSHMGISVNVTHRNWTGVGNPECPVEPIVDPRGLVTPYPPAWSIDTWCVIEGARFFPSSSPGGQQHLVEEAPVVETVFAPAGHPLVLTCWTIGTVVHLRASLTNAKHTPARARLAFAVRPFNPEGVSLIHRLEWDPQTEVLRVDDAHTLSFSRPPDRLGWGSWETGDCAARLGDDGGASSRDAVQGKGEKQTGRIRCPQGLANGFAAFEAVLGPGETLSAECSCPLTPPGLSRRPPAGAEASGPERSLEYWRALLEASPSLKTPDAGIEAAFRASLSTLLMLADGSSITPGPCTYHQFWFRDAVFMLWALDKTGYHAATERIFTSFPSRQERSGYFRSQQGEWDSNGEALWSLWQHTLFSGKTDGALALFGSMDAGARWIDAMRTGGGTRSAGLLPAGLSAEHLGLTDFYFWDDFWSIAGVEAFGQLCALAGRWDRRAYAAGLAAELRRSVENAIRELQVRRGISEIPAGPFRGIDVGMIGTCCAWYPLQLYPRSDPRMAATLDHLAGEFTHEGMYFQSFIHSGMNPYLTLQLAHAFLYGGRRERFWDMLTNVLSRASATLNFPEAIHPLTGGGVMGDGHHGWAAAEVVLAIRDAFLYEDWSRDGEGHDLVFFAGIPAAWFMPGLDLAFRNAPVPGGIASVEARAEGDQTTIVIAGETSGRFAAKRWIVRLPWRAGSVCLGGKECADRTVEGEETVIILQPGPHPLTLRIR